MSKVKIAIVGIGNCASSLIQGIHYYREKASWYACRPIFIWAAISKQPLEKDQAVTVHDLEGLVLKVEPVSESESTNAELQT